MSRVSSSIVGFLSVLLLLQTAPDPQFTARWIAPGVARLSWTQPADIALTCLHRNTTFLRCWADLPAGATAITFGDVGPLDTAAHPAIGDIYVLDQDGTVTRAPLLYPLYLPGIAKPPGVRRLWVAVVERG